MRKTGLVVEGGGMRGIYSAGVLDAFLEMGLHFDYCVGASAGGANIATFQAKQLKRNYRFYYEYGVEKDFLSLHSFLKTGQYFGLDYIYDDLATTSGKDPLDYKTMIDDPSELEFVATNVNTGKPAYLSKHLANLNNYDVIKASCAIPIACKAVEIDGVPYVDGGVSDPLPIQRAIDQGCDFVVVVLVRSWPREIKKRKRWFYDLTLKNYPDLTKAIMTCDELHDLQDRLCFAYQKMGKVMVIMPEHDEFMSSNCKDQKKLHEFYMQGYKDAYACKDLLLEKIDSKPTIFKE